MSQLRFIIVKSTIVEIFTTKIGISERRVSALFVVVVIFKTFINTNQTTSQIRQNIPKNKKICKKT